MTSKRILRTLVRCNRCGKKEAYDLYKKRRKYCKTCGNSDRTNGYTKILNCKTCGKRERYQYKNHKRSICTKCKESKRSKWIKKNPSIYKEILHDYYLKHKQKLKQDPEYAQEWRNKQKSYRDRKNSK